MAGAALLTRWHRLLRLPRQPPPWYKDRLREELSERRAATSPLARLSETSDVLYILSRARHDQSPLRFSPQTPLPFIILSQRLLLAYPYMVCKYTSRWAFYRAAAWMCDHPCAGEVREVVNPARDGKLLEVATRHGMEPLRFQRVCGRLRRLWPLLP